MLQALHRSFKFTALSSSRTSQVKIDRSFRESACSLGRDEMKCFEGVAALFGTATSYAVTAETNVHCCSRDGCMLLRQRQRGFRMGDVVTRQCVRQGSDKMFVSCAYSQSCETVGQKAFTHAHSHSFTHADTKARDVAFLVESSVAICDLKCAGFETFVCRHCISSRV